MMLIELDTLKLRSALKSQDIRQADLAERSGVSRAQLSRLFSQNRATIRMKTLVGLAQALHLEPAELILEGRRERYLQWLIESHGYIDFRGIGLPQVQKQPIDDVFVEPSVKSEVWQEKTDGSCAQPKPSLGRDLRSPPRRGLASELILAQDRVVILGEPGSGKTTILRWLACQAARGKLSPAVLPVFVRLSELNRALEIDPGVDLVSVVARVAADSGCPETEGLFREGLDRGGTLLVLLDGLDEIGQEGVRDRLVETVKTFVERYPRNRYVLTARPAGFDPRPWNCLGFSTVRILGYSQRQLDDFVKKWSRILPAIFGRSEKEAKRSLEDAIFSSPRVRALASNPLMLTILSLLNESRGGTLPRRRVDLYAKVVDVFLDTWERTKRAPGAFDETSDIDLDAREFGWLMADFALAMQKNDRTLAPRWWITERMRDCLQNKLGFTSDQASDASARILRFLAERAGLLREQGLDQFGFSHRTLQEYFAAKGVIDEASSSGYRDVTDSLRNYLFNPHWREVVRLVAAQLTPPAAESLVTSIVDDCDPVGRFLRRGPLLALGCLADGATVANRSFISSIFKSLADLGRSRWLGITLATLETLDAFEGTRLQKPAEDTIRAILETAKRDLDPDDYFNLQINRSSIFEEAERNLGGLGKEAARDVKLDLNGKPLSIVFINDSLRAVAPRAWLESVCSLLEDEARGAGFKEVLIRELGHQIATEARSRRVLRKLLETAKEPRLRSACARALSTGARIADARLLLRTLDRENEDAEVRGACAEGLRKVADTDSSIRAKLSGILSSNAPDALRAGAAHALGRAARKDSETRVILLQLASRGDTADELRLACSWALSGQLGGSVEVASAFRGWLDLPGNCRLRQVAAQALGDAMAADKIPWDHAAVERIEQLLMGLQAPCPHALESLEALAAARELRRGLRLEGVLRDALKPVAEQIELAFVFGSTARKRQTEDSDIDLMVIGDVRLKDLSTPLSQAEKTLGRRVNPALYTREAFRQRYQAGDPFLIDVCRREKLAVILGGSAAGRRGLEHELRAMVAERLAPA